jgi:hypothetical protein
VHGVLTDMGEGATSPQKNEALQNENKSTDLDMYLNSFRGTCPPLLFFCRFIFLAFLGVSRAGGFKNAKDKTHKNSMPKSFYIKIQFQFFSLGF